MSIIERAADIFGPAKSAQEPAAGEEVHYREPGLIERSSSSIPKHSTVPADHQRAGEAVARGAADPGGRISKTLAVDRDRLRRQNMIIPDGERSPISENFRRVKRHILANATAARAELGSNLVMVTSALAGEGKTFCAINLAISIAMEMDRTVLLVDADVAKPSVTSALGVNVEGERGLMDVLLDRRIDLAGVLCRTDIGSLSLLPAGTRHVRATEMLASERMRVLLHEIAERYHDRIVIFDSPPLLVASEACALASRMGQIIVVVEAGRTTEAALKDALARIESSNVRGVLLNKGAAPGAGYFGDYEYGYGHGYG